MDIGAFLDAREQAAAIDGIELGPLRRQPPRPDGERDRFWQWVDDETPSTQIGSSLRRTVEHLQTFRDAGDDLDIVYLHYDGLKADLEGQMRHLAARLGIDVDAYRWPRLVQSATFESMRARADTIIPGGDPQQWIDPAAFFRRGTSGQWRDLLDEADLAPVRSARASAGLRRPRRLGAQRGDRLKCRCQRRAKTDPVSAGEM
jgi:aryl sulfotransferase